MFVNRSRAQCCQSTDQIVTIGGQKIRVCILSESTVQGGLADQISQLARLLSAQGHDLYLVLNKSDDAWKNIQHDEVLESKIIWYKAFLTPGSSPPGLQRSIKSLLVQLLEFPMLNLLRRRYLKQIVDLGNVDLLIVSNGGFPGGQWCLAAALENKRTHSQQVHWIHNSYSETAYRLSPFWFSHFLRKTLVGVTLVTPSKAVANSLLELDSNLQFSVVPNYVDKVKGSQRPLMCNGDRVKVLCASAFLPHKGQAYLIEAAQILKMQGVEIELRFRGSGEDRYINELRKLARERGLESDCSFGDFIQDKAALYEDIDIVVLPTIKFEAFGLVLTEAMSLGIPAVGSNVGGIPEVLGSRAEPLIFEPGDSKQLSKIILSLVSDPEQYEFWSDYFLKRFESVYGYDAYIDRLHKVLPELKNP